MSDDYCAIGATAAEASGLDRQPGRRTPSACCAVKPTEYPESYKGITLCPVCEWQEASAPPVPGDR